MRLSLPDRAFQLWHRHRRQFWIAHSVWSLVTGAAIVLLVRERYHLVAWVVGFLALTWALTLFFGRTAAAADRTPGLAHELTSYITRVLYQETLFFLIPFYAASTVPGSANTLFLAALVGLAVLSCMDLLFDQWLRTRPVFALTFFATVAFAALNLLLPLLVGLAPGSAAPVAAALSIGGVAPLTLRAAAVARRVRLRLVAAAAGLLAMTLAAPALIPPVPLRLMTATFATAIDAATLTPRQALASPVSPDELRGHMVFVIAQVFAPSALPTGVRLEWRRDGELLRVSREVTITAHPAGFRVWDGWRAPPGRVSPGHYTVLVRTAGGQAIGRAALVVDE